MNLRWVRPDGRGPCHAVRVDADGVPVTRQTLCGQRVMWMTERLRAASRTKLMWEVTDLTGKKQCRNCAYALAAARGSEQGGEGE